MLGVRAIDTRASSSYKLRIVRAAPSSMNKFRFLSCAVLCCPVLCCAVLPCAVLCCAALPCAVLYCAGLLSCNIERNDVYQSRREYRNYLIKTFEILVGAHYHHVPCANVVVA